MRLEVEMNTHARSHPRTQAHPHLGIKSVGCVWIRVYTKSSSTDLNTDNIADLISRVFTPFFMKGIALKILPLISRKLNIFQCDEFTKPNISFYTHAYVSFTKLL
jgi:hypothetical protein